MPDTRRRRRRRALLRLYAVCSLDSGTCWCGVRSVPRYEAVGKSTTAPTVLLIIPTNRKERFMFDLAALLEEARTATLSLGRVQELLGLGLFEVQMGVLQNPQAPEYAFYVLAEESNIDVRAAASDVSGRGGSEFEASAYLQYLQMAGNLKRQRVLAVWGAMVSHERCPLDVLRRLVLDPWRGGLLYLDAAKNTVCPADLLGYMAVTAEAVDGGDEALEIIAQHPNTPVATLQYVEQVAVRLARRPLPARKSAVRHSPGVDARRPVASGVRG